MNYYFYNVLMYISGNKLQKLMHKGNLDYIYLYLILLIGLWVFEIKLYLGIGRRL